MACVAVLTIVGNLYLPISAPHATSVDFFPWQTRAFVRVYSVA